MSDGALSLSKGYLRATIADCTAFRTWTSAATQAAALARIYRDVLPLPATAGKFTLAELEKLRPYCLIWSEQLKDTRIATATYESLGVLTARFVWDIPRLIRDQPDEAVRQLEVTVGEIVEEMEALAGTAGYLNIADTDLRAAGLGDKNDYPSKGYVAICELSITWEG